MRQGKLYMKKILWLMVIVFLINGCAGLKIKRGVQDNVFYSSSQPRIAVRIDSDYKYIDSKTNFDIGFDDTGSNTTGIVKKLFCFENIYDQREIIIYIARINAPRWRFMTQLIPEKNAYIAEKVNINGFTYQHVIFPEKHELGTILTSALARRVGAKNDALIIIYLIEPVDGGNWGDVDSLTESQRKILTLFKENSKKDIHILKEVVIPTEILP